MSTLRLKKPFASGKHKVVFPINQVYNYKTIDNDFTNVLVQHHINTDVFVPQLRKDIIFID